MRDEFAEDFAKRDPSGYQALVSQCLLFGDNGCGQYWGFKRDSPGSVILWDTEWGVDFQVAGGSPLEVWRAEKQAYDALDAGA